MIQTLTRQNQALVRLLEDKEFSVPEHLKANPTTTTTSSSASTHLSSFSMFFESNPTDSEGLHRDMGLDEGKHAANML